MISAARAATATGLVVAAAACAGGDPPQPSSLSDGSAARPPPVALEGVEGPSVETRVRVVSRERLASDSATAACAGSPRVLGSVAIERVDVHGTSVTYLGRGRRAAYGCDGSGGASTREPWCGRAYGRLVDGRLRDPRLSLGCRDSGGRSLGSAWIQPLSETEYVVVSRSGYNVVYPVARRLPVRVTSDDVDLDASRATFDVSEHDRDGRRLREYELEAAASG